MTSLHYARKGDRFLLPECFGSGPVTLMNIMSDGRVQYCFGAPHNAAMMPASDFIALALPESPDEMWKRADAAMVARMDVSPSESSTDSKETP